MVRGVPVSVMIAVMDAIIAACPNPKAAMLHQDHYDALLRAIIAILAHNEETGAEAGEDA